ncbi:class I SAM-dependent methyltransferase [Microlunatus soli]|uniref:Methyltransferase domain-containing protein n=1 Tax=Microlunatus soli TaxID=630515 RepID=A0A1H1NLS8_9ACTN|nr:class I SAM-dependent methyltransferase [Microlunatus soli]SDR99867.1 hypothetical protein SAMN04489812_0562 [Microlunatus soli]
MAEPALPGTPWRPARRFGPVGRSAILFGVSYEDERVESDAFGPPGEVCVIGASGETAAACAAAGHRVTAVDINPSQLDYARNRLAGGPIRIGLAERVMRVGRALLRVAAPAWRMSELGPRLASAGPEQAADYWQRSLDTTALSRLLGGTIRPAGAVLRTIRPAARATFPASFDAVIRQRIGEGLARHGMVGNRFAWRLLAGCEDRNWSLPSARTLPAVAPSAGGPAEIVWVRADIGRHLETVPAGRYDGLSLSNVLDGADPDYRRRLLAAAHRAVRPGGTIVLRSFAPLSAAATLHAGPFTALDASAADASLIWGTVTVLRTR